MFNNFRKQLASFIAPVRNSMNIANRFLRLGSGTMVSKWSEVMMRDEDSYKGLSFAAIHKRAVYVAQIASENIAVHEDAADPSVEHPYQVLTYDSKEFSEYWFWYCISTYLDLKGVYYLMVVRAKDEKRAKGAYSNPLKLKLLNPYRVRRVLDPATMEVTGYVEVKGGMVREIPPEMIIEVRELNPFNETDDFSMAMAAKEGQFTLNSSGDYTRHVINNNINAPGILSTDVILGDEEFENFKARVTKHTKGEPLFGNGAGVINWQSMTMDLSKAALKDIHEINGQQVSVVYGVSKTILGIEVSGTTRETANVQERLFVKSEILPRIQMILDALNLDYRNRYPQDYAVNKSYLIVNNPLATDHDADAKDAEVKQKRFDLYTDLVDKGYDPKKAAKYVKGEIDLEKLGKPKNPPADTAQVDENGDPITPAADAKGTQSRKKKDKIDHQHNAISPEQARQERFLKNSLISVEGRIVSEVIKKIEKKTNAKHKATNAYEVIADIIGSRDKSAIVNELEGILQAFYGTTIASEGIEAMKRRTLELEMSGTFSFDNLTKKYIKELSLKVSDSHVDTVLSDLLVTTREAALEGLGQKEIISRLTTEYADTITKTRATTVARTETNRSFTRAQYEADRQFIEQNDLQGQVFKRWKVRSNNPCPFCESLEAEGDIPFDVAFRDLGTEISVGQGEDKKQLKVNFEALEAGNAHPNCSCIYELVIKE